MKKLLALLVLAVAPNFGQTAETLFLRAVLSPANEVPPVNLNASGTATIRAHVVRNAAGQIVSGTVDFIVDYNFPGAVELTGLHIHRGVAGENGPVVINSGIGGAAGNIVDEDGRGTINRSGQVLSSDANGVAALRGLFDNPSGYYVNLHSTVNPGGVIRGQLVVPQLLHLMTLLETRNEVPPVSSNASGVAAVTLMRTFDSAGAVNSAMVLFEVDFNLGGRKTLSGLHVHRERRGVNGPVVVNSGLTSRETADSGQGSLVFPVEVDVSRPAQLDIINEMFEDPSGFYVNLHTTEFPGGVIRGQLRRTDAMTFSMNLSPRNEVPPLSLDASAPSALHINTIRNEAGEVEAARVTFDVNYRFAGAATFTGLHIHNQVAGANGPVAIDSRLSATDPVQTETGFGNIYRSVLVNSTVGLATVNSLIANPERHYMNLHTSVNPGGAVRAQVGEPFSSPPAIGDAASAVLDRGQRNVAPGGWLSIFGQRFAHAATDYWAWEGLRLPNELNGVHVSIGGVRAPLLKVSPGQIDVVVPFETAVGRQPVVVHNAAGASQEFLVTVERFAPAIWRLGETGGQIVRVRGPAMDDIAFVTPESPARLGDLLVVIATGLGQTVPALQTGRVVPEAGLFSTAPVMADIGGRMIPAIASVALPGVPGTYATVVALLPGVGPGLQPFTLVMGGARSNTVMLPLQAVLP